MKFGPYRRSCLCTAVMAWHITASSIALRRHVQESEAQSGKPPYPIPDCPCQACTLVIPFYSFVSAAPYNCRQQQVSFPWQRYLAVQVQVFTSHLAD